MRIGNHCQKKRTMFLSTSCLLLSASYTRVTVFTPAVKKSSSKGILSHYQIEIIFVKEPFPSKKVGIGDQP
jgi:hypothetical protein